jgi:enamine deaminase RidA (YjgF/YER057c/UK114 family)
MQRNNISSGTNYEKQLGYSRVVRIGPHIAIASTAAINRLGEIQHIDDAYAQTTYILNKIQKVVAAAGANLHHILRTRLYLRNVDHWQDVGRAHRDFLAPFIRPLL